MKKFINDLIPYIIIVIVVVLFRTFIMTPAVVDGLSMYDTLNDHDIVLINKIVMKTNNINRFDIVVLKNNEDGDKIIKRIIGLPGEKIEDNFKTNETTDFTAETKENEYFVLGDNRELSKDSRYLGNFKKENIIGKVDFRFYPFDKLGLVE